MFWCSCQKSHNACYDSEWDFLAKKKLWLLGLLKWESTATTAAVSLGNLCFTRYWYILVVYIPRKAIGFHFHVFPEVAFSVKFRAQPLYLVSTMPPPPQKKQVLYELGQPSLCQRGRLAMPRSIQCIRILFLDTMLLMHQPWLFFSERYVRYKHPRNTKAPITCMKTKKKKKKKNGFTFVCACGSNTSTALNFQIEISQNCAGHRRNAIFAYFCRNHLTYMLNRLLVISLNGWRTGQSNSYRCSPCGFSIVSTNFHSDRERRFLFGFSVEKLVFLSFRGCLGEIESRKKSLRIFHIRLFVLHVQCCVRGSVHPIFKPYLAKAVALEL